MTLAFLRYLAMTYGSALAAASRPAATFLAVQMTVAVLVAEQYAALPPRLTWMISPPAIAVAVVLTGVNTAAQHDPDMAAITRDLYLDNLTAGLGTLSATLLFAALVGPDAAVGEAAAGAVASNDLLGAVAQAAAEDRSLDIEIAAIVGAVLLNLGVTWTRSELLMFLDEFELGNVWAFLETGGVLAVLVVLPLLPLVAFAFMALFALALALLAWTARTARSAIDRRLRVPCQHCDYELRPEATLCPECHTVRSPTAEPTSGVAAARAALRSD